METRELRGSLERQIFTCGSVPSLVGKVANLVENVTRQRRRDRLFFVKDKGAKERFEIKTARIGERQLGFERCPGLSCRVRVFWIPRKQYLLLNFLQHPHCTEEELKQALCESTPEKMKSLTSPIKKLTVEVGLSGVGKSRRNRFQKSIRLSDRQRFLGKGTPKRFLVDPQQPANLIKSTYDGKVSIFKVGSSAIKERMEALSATRSPNYRRTIYTDPKQSADEVLLHLLIYLRQEGMVSESVDETLRELVEKCFKIKDKRDSIPVLGALWKNFTLPEDWRAMKLYVRRVKRSFKGKDVQSGEIVFSDDLEKEQEVRKGEAHGRIYAGKGKPPRRIEIKKPEDKKYTVKEAVKRLNAEGYEVSPDRLHDWINKGQIKCKHTQRGGKPLRCLDDGILEAVRQKLKHQRNRRLLMNYLTGTKERETARKYINRHLQKGESIEDIKRLVTRE